MSNLSKKVLNVITEEAKGDNKELIRLIGDVGIKMVVTAVSAIRAVDGKELADKGKNAILKDIENLLSKAEDYSDSWHKKHILN